MSCKHTQVLLTPPTRRHALKPSTRPVVSAGMQDLHSLNLHGCRNITSLPGEALPLLQTLTALTSLMLRNCEGLQDGALATTALASLHHLDLSGMTYQCFPCMCTAKSVINLQLC